MKRGTLAQKMGERCSPSYGTENIDYASALKYSASRRSHNESTANGVAAVRAAATRAARSAPLLDSALYSAPASAPTDSSTSSTAPQPPTSRDTGQSTATTGTPCAIAS